MNRAALLSIFLMSSVFGCGSVQESPLDRAQATPLSVALPARTRGDLLPTLDANTGSVQLKVSTQLVGRKRAVSQRFQLSEQLADPSRAGLRIELSGIPITVSARQVDKTVWEFEFSQNILQLLSKAPQTAEYSGTLVIEGTRSKLPLTLTLSARKADRDRSAG